MKTIAFFNNKGGVGKSSLAYHLAWMFDALGVRVLASDLDPQANLTNMFLNEDRLEKLWKDKDRNTLFGMINPILKGTGDITNPHVETVGNIGLLVGDLGLSGFEDRLSDAWPRCLDGDEAAFRVISAFYRGIELAAQAQESEVVLIDVGPNLGAINRAAILSAQYVVVPLSPDLFSLQGLYNLGPTLREWRRGWEERIKKNPDPELSLPEPWMNPIGYVVMQHAMRLDRPVKAYERWMARIPKVYQTSVLGKSSEGPTPIKKTDPNRLEMVKHYRSLMPLAMDARKPIFSLKYADGAIGSHANAVKACYEDFKGLAQEIAKRTELEFTS